MLSEQKVGKEEEGGRRGEETDFDGRRGEERLFTPQRMQTTETTVSE